MTPKDQINLKRLAELLKIQYPALRIRFQNQYLNEDCGDYCLSYDTIEQATEAIDEGYQRTVITVEVK